MQAARFGGWLARVCMRQGRHKASMHEAFPSAGGQPIVTLTPKAAKWGIFRPDLEGVTHAAGDTLPTAAHTQHAPMRHSKKASSKWTEQHEQNQPQACLNVLPSTNERNHTFHVSQHHTLAPPDGTRPHTMSVRCVISTPCVTPLLRAEWLGSAEVRRGILDSA